MTTLQEENLINLLDGYVEKGGHHLNVNVFNKDTLLDAQKNPDIIKAFTRAIQKGLDFVNNNDSQTIAESILSFFPDTSLNDLVKVIERYKKQDTWPKTTSFTEESFNHLQDIMMNAGHLDKKVKYNDLIYELGE